MVGLNGLIMGPERAVLSLHSRSFHPQRLRLRLSFFGRFFPVVSFGLDLEMHGQIKVREMPRVSAAHRVVIFLWHVITKEYQQASIFNCVSGALQASCLKPA